MHERKLQCGARAHEALGESAAQALLRCARCAAPAALSHATLTARLFFSARPAAWNAVIRLYPSHRFWLFAANDIAFPPGQLERLYAKVRASAGDEDAGMLSASVDFGKSSRRAAGGAAAAADDDDNRRKTSFGMIVWAMFRQGILRTGLFDENFYPG